MRNPDRNDRKVSETLALLKILALGNDQIARGETRPAAAVFADLRRGLVQRSVDDDGLT